MFWSNSHFKLIGYFLLSVLLQAYCLSEHDKATSVPVPGVVKGTADVSVPTSDELVNNAPPKGNNEDTQVSTHSRFLKQSTHVPQYDEEFECGLSSSERQRYFEDLTQRWIVTDEVLLDLDNDIQAIVNCTSENDIVVFQSIGVIRPSSTIIVPWNLTLKADSSATFTCPLRGPLLISRSPSSGLENLVIVDCNGTSSVIVLSQTCDDEGKEGTVQLNHVTFQDNGVFDRGHILEANKQCSRLSITGLVFLRNKCIGTHCVVLGLRNTLTNVYFVNNQGSDDTSLDSSVFFASIGSRTVAKEVTAMNNTIRSLHISDSILRIRDSQFDDNKKSDSLGTRSSSIGGGIVFSNHSSVTISNSVFQRNDALNGGVVFAWSSNVSVSDCVFRENDAGEGNGGALYGHYNSSFDITSSEFVMNRGYRGAVLYSNYTLRVSMLNVSALENNSSRFGGVWISNGAVDITSSAFFQNNAFRGGGALCFIGVQLSLMNSTLTGNDAGFGGACLFENNCTINSSALLFENNTARGTDGGAICLIFGSRMKIGESVFRNNYGLDDGGAIHVDGECEVVMERVVFLNNTSGDNGGAIQVRFGNFSGSNLTFRRNRATKSGGAISFYEANIVSISRSHFEGNHASAAGAVLFLSTPWGYIDQCTFVENLGHSRLGGAISSLISNVNVSSSVFRANTAYIGGSIVLFERCNSTILNSTFENNTARGGGGAIAISTASSLVLSTSFFKGNRGVFGGTIVATYSSISISRVDFVENYASSGGCMILYDFGKAVITDTLFSNNTARNGGGAIFLRDKFNLFISRSIFAGNNGETFGGGVRVHNNSNVELNVVKFEQNKAKEGGALQLADSCTAIASNCSFTNNTSLVGGGAIQIANNSTISLTNSTISGNNARFGGGFLVEKNSTANVSHTNLVGNNALSAGGAIYLQTSNVFLISVKLDFNKADYGGSLYSLKSSMEMRNSATSRSYARRTGGAMYVSESNATLEKTLLKSNDAVEDCGGICAMHASHIYASNVQVVSNNAGDVGGGIAIGSTASLMCYSCLLLNNRAFSGAGLYASSNNSLAIVAQLQNCKFENNYAHSHGGGIEFVASTNTSINCSSSNLRCGHIVLLNVTFEDNFADRSGAIVLTTDAKRVLIDCDYQWGRNEHFLDETYLTNLDVLDPTRLCSSWTRNTIARKEYGDVVGTFGQKVMLTIDPSDEVRLVGNIANGFVLENVSSGRQLPTINVIVLDGYGRWPAVTFPPVVEARISSPNDFIKGQYLTNIVSGVGNFSRVIGLVHPGTYTLDFWFNNSALKRFNVTIIVRECRVGEEPTRDKLTCQACDAFSYNFNASKVGGCNDCPTSALCRGRYIVPEEGYWHNSPCHDQVNECLVDKACSYKNRIEVLTNFTQNFTDCSIDETTLDQYNDALCNEGYNGPLCGSCKKAYGLSFRFQCFSCPRRIASILTLLGLTLYLLISSALTIRGTLPSPSPKPVKSTTRGQSNNGASTSSQDVGIEMEVEESLPQDSIEDEEQETKSRPINTTTCPTLKTISRFDLIKWKSTEILKIMINFLQTTAIAAAVNVQWNDEVLELFEASEYLGVLTTDVASGHVDCIISSDCPMTRSKWRILFTIIVHGFVIGVFVTFWSGMTYKKKHNIMYLLKRSFLSTIVVIYISYLGLTQLAVRVFYCVDVIDSVDPSTKDQSTYWAIDTAVTCYGKAHIGLIVIAVILLLFVSLGFPITSAFILTYTKANVRQSGGWQLETMGFLYRAFKEEFVYWESLVMLRKAILSIIVVFSYPLGGQIQGLLATLVLIFSLYFHQKCAPFRQEFSALNLHESVSLLVSCVTFVLGQFFNADKSSDMTRTLIAVVIIVCNTSFFAVLGLVLVGNVIEQLRESLQNANASVSQNTPWWKVLKLFIISKLLGMCPQNK